jgi:hypothetical protein
MEPECDDYADGPPEPPPPWWFKDVVYPAAGGIPAVAGVLVFLYLMIRPSLD